MHTRMWMVRFAAVALPIAACSSSDATNPASDGTTSTTSTGTAGGSTTGAMTGVSAGTTSSTGATMTTATTTGAGGASASTTTATSTGVGGAPGTTTSTTTSTGAGGATGGFPAGWLYTTGSKIYVSEGNGAGKQWMGRGVNFDDIFLCGYNYTLWMSTPDVALKAVAAGLISAWKPNFIRLSLGMDSYPSVVSWTSNAAQYETPMTGVINAIGANPGVHVLVTLRSDVSMIGQDTVDGDAEATGLPSDKTTTPDAVKYPTGTDATYIALVDTFANDGFVLFGLTNEPGGNKLSNAKISAAMSHAVGTIRAEEDKLKVPHHIVSVQGNGWTSDISFYAQTPLPYDNVVYEVHGYPPAPSSYTYANIPVILGEYGTLANSTTFYADVEAKQIPNMAWDFDSYSDCAPDLLQVNQSDMNLLPSAWGTTVQSYLLAHAQ